MAAKGNKPAELTDIPLTLEHGDSVQMSSIKTDKLKSNSLKRFFRTARSGNITASKSTDSNDLADNMEVKSVRSQQLRFGSFRKNDGARQTTTENLEASSSVDHTKSSESRISLQGRISNYWNNVFKRTKKGQPEVVPCQDIVAPPADVNQIEQNQSENL